MSTSNIFNLIGKVVCYLLFALGVIFGALIIVNGSNLQADVALQDKLVTPSIIISIVAVILAIILAAVLPLFFTSYTKQGLIKSGATILGIVLIIVIAYLIPDAELSEEFMNNPELNVNPTISKLVGTGCYVTYFTFVAALLTILFSTVLGFIKKR